MDFEQRKTLIYWIVAIFYYYVSLLWNIYSGCCWATMGYAFVYHTCVYTYFLLEFGGTNIQVNFPKMPILICLWSLAKSSDLTLKRGKALVYWCISNVPCSLFMIKHTTKNCILVLEITRFITVTYCYNTVACRSQISTIIKLCKGLIKLVEKSLIICNPYSSSITKLSCWEYWLK